MDKRAKKKRLQNNFKEKLSNSTINGLAQVVSAENVRYRIFWSILLVIEVIGFSVNLYEITERFLRVPLLTQVERGQTNFTWPHITLCNPSNPIPFWTDQTLEPKWKSLFAKAEEMGKLMYGDKPAKAIWSHYIAMSSLNPPEFYAKGLDGMIQGFSYNYKESSVAFSSSDFDRFRSLSMKKVKVVMQGNLDSIRTPMPCYRIAPEKIGQVTTRGDDSNLLSVKLYILMDFDSLNIYNPAYESRKLYLYITHPNATIQSTSPYFIYSGTDSKFQISESSHRRIRMCRENEFRTEIYTVDLNSSQKFYGGFEECRMHVSQTMFLQKCGCMNPFLPIYKFENATKFPRLCTNTSIYSRTQMEGNVKCLNSFIHENKAFQRKLMKVCDPFRISPCYSKTYTVIRDSNAWQAAQSKLRNEYMTKNVNRLKNAKSNSNLSTDFVNLNLAIVNLYWSREPPEATYEEREYPLSQFISDFGGTAGLWIGLSLISVFELTELACAAFNYCRT